MTDAWTPEDLIQRATMLRTLMLDTAAHQFQELQAVRTHEAELIETLTVAVRLAKEATNGWACYAKRKIEHAEIARLHQAIDALDELLKTRDEP
jgi:hypothetical protein